MFGDVFCCSVDDLEGVGFGVCGGVVLCCDFVIVEDVVDGLWVCFFDCGDVEVELEVGMLLGYLDYFVVEDCCG